VRSTLERFEYRAIEAIGQTGEKRQLHGRPPFLEMKTALP
jgi:hypothetical protein